MKYERIRVMGGIVAGFALGAVVALLTAPEKGEKTRKKIEGEATKFKGHFNEFAKETMNSVRSILEDFASSAQENATKSVKAIESKTGADKT